MGEEFLDLLIQIPRTIVVATGEFDRYLESCGLDARGHSPEEFRLEIARRDLPPELLTQLRVALKTLTGPWRCAPPAIWKTPPTSPLPGCIKPA